MSGAENVTTEQVPRPARQRCPFHCEPNALRDHPEPCHNPKCDGTMRGTIAYAPDVGLHWIACPECGWECFNRTVNWPGNR